MLATIQVVKLLGMYLVKATLADRHSKDYRSTCTILHDHLYGLLEHHLPTNSARFWLYYLILQRTGDNSRPGLPEQERRQRDFERPRKHNIHGRGRIGG